MGFGFDPFRLGTEFGTEMQADDLERALRCGTHEAIMAHSGKTFRQNMQQPAPYEFLRTEGKDTWLMGVAGGPV